MSFPARHRLWTLARRPSPVLPRKTQSAPMGLPDKKVVPLSRIIARAVPANLLSLSGTPAPLMDVDVLSYAVLDATGHSETVPYANTPSRVREEVLAHRDGWRQSDRFKDAEERSAADFCRLFVD